jgi:hypothetical protein
VVGWFVGLNIHEPLALSMMASADHFHVTSAIETNIALFVGAFHIK